MKSNFKRLSSLDQEAESILEWIIYLGFLPRSFWLKPGSTKGNHFSLKSAHEVPRAVLDLITSSITRNFSHYCSFSWVLSHFWESLNFFSPSHIRVISLSFFILFASSTSSNAIRRTSEIDVRSGFWSLGLTLKKKKKSPEVFFYE